MQNSEHFTKVYYDLRATGMDSGWAGFWRGAGPAPFWPAFPGPTFAGCWQAFVLFLNRRQQQLVGLSSAL